MFFFLLSSTVLADTISYPGDAPCNGTLQDCIDAAANGDTIELATNNRINESLTIKKSITLTTASGFAPKLGSTTSLIPKIIAIEDDDEAIMVSFTHLLFDNAVVEVSFSLFEGNSFTMQHSTLSNPDDHNNTHGIDLNLRTSSTILLQHNTILSSGAGLNVLGSLNENNTASVSLFGNRISTTNNSDYNYQGIRIDNTFKGEFNVDIQSNVIHNIGGCNCGGPAGVEIYQDAVGTANFNILNNTFESIAGNGIIINTLDFSSGLTLVNIFNNTVSNVENLGISLPDADANLIIVSDYNNFHQNQNGEEWGDYEPGDNNLAVDPLFMNIAQQNYRLQTSSPLLNAGNSSVSGLLFSSVDAANSNRNVGAEIDLGAYEAATDLQLFLSISANTVTVGDELSATAQIINNGPDADTASFSGSITSGKILFTEPSQGICNNTDTELTCTLGEIADLENVTIAITIEATEEGLLSFNANTTGTRPDQDLTNNSASTGDIDTNLVTNGINASGTNGGGGCQLGVNTTQATPLQFFLSVMGAVLLLGSFKRKLQR